VPEEYEQTRLLRLAQCFFKAHILNFFAFVVITLIIGGAATWGYQKDGHFFVGKHGHYVQVSRGIYQFSEIHGTYSIITILITLAGTIIQRKSNSLRISLSWKEWASASTVPLFWFLMFIILRLMT